MLVLVEQKNTFYFLKVFFNTFKNIFFFKTLFFFVFLTSFLTQLVCFSSFFPFLPAASWRLQAASEPPPPPAEPSAGKDGEALSQLQELQQKYQVSWCVFRFFFCF